MSTKLYVGNLSFTASEDHLSDLFQQYGAVNSARIILDRETSRSKGFAFVEMSEDADAQRAIHALNGSAFEGRNLTVSEARPMEPRGDRSGSRPSFRGSRY